MTNIASEIIIDQSVESVYLFLSDFNNHQGLMPDSISNWASTTDSASFDIQNMGNLKLTIQKRTENEAILLVPEGRTPFPLSMVWSMQPLEAQQTQVKLTIEADLNMMMKMIATAPLKKLTETQTAKLKALLKSPAL